jgi:Family of unknown function (DUF5522)
MLEGVDYYIEDGKCVLTVVYLLKRGYCCGNICRHCPYGQDIQAAAAGGKKNSEGSASARQTVLKTAVL